MPDAGSHARTDLRKTVMLRARIVDSRGTHEAHVSDISSFGLLGTMENPPARGDFISIQLPTQEFGAHVRWVNGNRFGVRLREEVDGRAITRGRRRKRSAHKASAPVPKAQSPLNVTVVIYAVLCLAAVAGAYLLMSRSIV